MYLVNSAALSRDYSNLELPIDVYYSAMNGPASSPASAPCPTTTGCDWQRANGAGHAPRALSRVAKLSNSVGSLTLRLPPGAYYEIVVPTGGTYFCVATTESARASLSPSFFVSVQKA